MTAFHRYLTNIPEYDAVVHVIDCLKNGPSNNMAWDLMAEFNGPNWRCPPKELPGLILKAIRALKQHAEDEASND